jgi:hypothetical protein
MTRSLGSTVRAARPAYRRGSDKRGDPKHVSNTDPRGRIPWHQSPSVWSAPRPAVRTAASHVGRFTRSRQAADLTPKVEACSRTAGTPRCHVTKLNQATACPQDRGSGRRTDVTARSFRAYLGCHQGDRGDVPFDRERRGCWLPALGGRVDRLGRGFVGGSTAGAGAVSGCDDLGCTER